MNTAAVIVGILSCIALGRVLFLNAEIKTLDSASIRFGRLVEGWRTSHGENGPIPTNIAEAEIEYDWLVNTRDLKKESRTVWLGGSGLLLVLLVAALFEIVRK